jgi:SAM-dependent methyltransferase
VDGSSYALQQASLRGFDALHLVQDFSFDRIPLEDNLFDLIINKDVLEHLLNPENLVREMSRITKHNGQVLVVVPKHFPIVGRFRLLQHNTIDPLEYFPNSHRWDFPHVGFFNKTDFLLMMSHAGLNPKSCLSHHFPSIPKFGRLMTKRVRGLLAHTYPDAFAEAHAWLFQKR